MKNITISSRKHLTSDAAKKYFNTDTLINYLDEHKEGKADNSRKIWTVYMFLVWYNDYFGDGYNPELPAA